MKNEVIFAVLNEIKQSCEAGFLQLNDRITSMENKLKKIEQNGISTPSSSNFTKIENCHDEKVSLIQRSASTFWVGSGLLRPT